jgi:hypothetical protein
MMLPETRQDLTSSELNQGSSHEKKSEMLGKVATGESSPQVKPAVKPVAKQANNPLHGLTLEKIVTDLVDYYGWQELGQLIHIKCFIENPSINSSLKFLRKTTWAREKVESLYLYTLREHNRSQMRARGIRV